jgi:hypothetical protein
MKEYVKGLICLIILLTCSVILTGCGSDSLSSDSKSSSTKKTPSELIIGKWRSGDSSIEFNSKGDSVITENGERSQFTYKVTSEGSNGGKDTITVSLTDSDKQSSSETITFEDDNTIKIGESEFKRADAASGSSTNTNTNMKTNTNTNSNAGTGKSVSSANEAITIVKKLAGSEASKYKFEFSNEGQVIPDGQGNYNASRDDKRVSNGIDCYIVRVYNEINYGSDGVKQENFGWYFVSKSTGEVFEMTDPAEDKLEVLN